MLYPQVMSVKAQDVLSYHIKSVSPMLNADAMINHQISKSARTLDRLRINYFRMLYAIIDFNRTLKKKSFAFKPSPKPGEFYVFSAHPWHCHPNSLRSRPTHER